MTKRTTIYLDDQLLRAAKIKAVQLDMSFSDIISEALRLALKEDAIDLQAIHDRVKEPSRSYEAILKDLKKDGRI